MKKKTKNSSITKNQLTSTIVTVVEEVNKDNSTHHMTKVLSCKELFIHLLEEIEMKKVLLNFLLVTKTFNTIMLIMKKH